MSNIEKLGLEIDHEEKRIIIDPFPRENNAFGTLAYVITQQLTFIVPPGDEFLLNMLTPELGKQVKEEGWIVRRVTIDGDTTKFDRRIDDLLKKNNGHIIAIALMAFQDYYGKEGLEEILQRLEDNGIVI